ncbi:glutamate racemase [Caenimonas sp. SL110]|uniref:glutamate racemase n=1 Tax=Caenimonas sp. SL110 TaxID=1450524 RepID=UPI0009E35FD0|nr:glutamate racemase [Caenimonas sp. SL110]
MKPVGVFDSGLGGLSVLKALRAELPHEHFVYFADTGHAPYGERDDEFVAHRSRDIGRELVDKHEAKALVVACNTATAAAIHLLRQEFPMLPIVGVEPGLKPAAALSQTKHVGVMATRGTLASAKFRALHESLNGQAEFHLQACDGLADAIERGDENRIEALCQQYTRALGESGTNAGQIDTIVLGCTHYPFAQAVLARHLHPAVKMVETGLPVARQTRSLLDAAGLLNTDGCEGSVTLLSTGDLATLQAAADRWLG